MALLCRQAPPPPSSSARMPSSASDGSGRRSARWPPPSPCRATTPAGRWAASSGWPCTAMRMPTASLRYGRPPLPACACRSSCWDTEARPQIRTLPLSLPLSLSLSLTLPRRAAHRERARGGPEARPEPCERRRRGRSATSSGAHGGRRGRCGRRAPRRRDRRGTGLHAQEWAAAAGQPPVLGVRLLLRLPGRHRLRNPLGAG